jgi:hypothetical protein
MPNLMRLCDGRYQSAMNLGYCNDLLGQFWFLGVYSNCGMCDSRCSY